MIYSVYGEGTFFVMFSASAVFFVLSAMVSGAVLARTFHKKQAPAMWVRAIAATSSFFSGCCFSTALAALSAFDFVHPAIVLLLAALGWALLAPVVAACCAPISSLRIVIGRVATMDDFVDTEHGSGTTSSPNGLSEDSGSSDAALLGMPTLGAQAANALRAMGQEPEQQAAAGGPRRRHPNAAMPGDVLVKPAPPTAGADDANSTATSRAWQFVNRMPKQVRGIVYDATKRPAVHFGVFVAGFLLSAVLVLLTYGACFCSQPKELSFWVQRQGRGKLCPAGKPCWGYPVLGANCSELILVGHYSADSDTTPTGFRVDVCPAAGCGTAADMTFNGGVVGNAPITEDRRYVGSVVARGLDGRTVYIATPVYFLSNGQTVRGAPFRFRTAPCHDDPALGNLTVIGGGDYRVKGEGKAILQRAMTQYPDAAAFHLAGDLAYANNMRTCYERWDLFFSEILPALTRPSDGAIVPIVAGPGNHEGGGYLIADSPATRAESQFFYTQFFPHAFSSATPIRGQFDPTTTYHTHLIGDSLALIMLDSDVIHNVDTQLHFLDTALLTLPTAKHFTSTPNSSRAVAIQRRKVIVMYHNPAYPSHRDFDDVISASVRRSFVPKMEIAVADIAVVLEHHDHTFKRTHAIRGGRVVDNSDPFLDRNARGLVYIGDGALGVGEPDREVTDTWYIAKAKQNNHFIGIKAAPEGNTVRVNTYTHGENGEEIDHYRSLL